MVPLQSLEGNVLGVPGDNYMDVMYLSSQFVEMEGTYLLRGEA
jgi:hypothetical protein